MKLYTINEGNQHELLHYVEVEQDWLKTMQAKYDWENFNRYDNRMFKYMDALFDTMTRQKRKDESYYSFWQKLTRGQKVFWSFLAFNGDVDNGGVYQFFFNKPEHCLSLLEVLEEIKAEQLRQDYQRVLEEVLGKFDKIADLRQRFNDESQQWEERWEAFNEGYEELECAAAIEKYYYEDTFKQKLYRQMSDYIEMNLKQFAKTKQE